MSAVQKFRGHLQLLGTSIDEIAAACGVREAAVRNWVRGDRRPRLRQRVAIRTWCAAQGLDADELLPLLGCLPDDPECQPLPTPPHLTLVDPHQPAPAQEDDMPTTLPRQYLDDYAKWGLAEDPFEDLADPSNIFLPAQLKDIQRRLLRGIERQHLMALVGDPGSGKSTLLRRLQVWLASKSTVDLITPSTLDRTRITQTSLEAAIVRELTGTDTTGWPAERRSLLLIDELKQRQFRSQPVVVIDEAHTLQRGALLGIKRVWDSNHLFRTLSVLMVGQKPLAARLVGDRALAELGARTRILSIPSYDAKLTAEYLRWRFAFVKGNADTVFAPDAYQALAAKGQTALAINTLAVRAMNYARSQGDKVVQAAHVGRV